MKEKLGFGCLGNGTTVWDSSRERNSDYLTVAHISDDGSQISIYETLSLDARQKIEESAIDTFKSKYSKNTTYAVIVKSEWNRKIKLEIKAWEPSMINKRFIEIGNMLYIYVSLLHPVIFNLGGSNYKLYDSEKDKEHKFIIESDNGSIVKFKTFNEALTHLISLKDEK